MLIKLADPTTGLISDDSTMYSVYMVRNGVRNYFPISSTNTIELSLYSIEDINNLQFQTDEKSSVLINSNASTITVTAENGSQTSYGYTLTQTAPYSGLYPLINNISSNNIKSLIGAHNLEHHGGFNITVIDLIVESDYTGVIFGGNVFYEFQDISIINGNIPSSLGTSLSSTGFAYYIVGWGDGMGGSDWVSYPDWTNNFLFFRVIEDASKFNTNTTPKIKPSELPNLYAFLSTGIVVPIPTMDIFYSFSDILKSQYISFIDKQSLINALDNGSIDYLEVGVDIQPSDIEFVVSDLSIEEAVSLNQANALSPFTLDDIYNLSSTVSSQILNEMPNIDDYPFLKQFCEEVISGDLGYSPKYLSNTLSMMKTEVLDKVITLFSDPKFWLSSNGLGFLNTKFIYDRYKFVFDNYLLFDYKISKDSVGRLVVALSDLLDYYYKFSDESGTALLPETYTLLSEFPFILLQSKNNNLTLM